MFSFSYPTGTRFVNKKKNEVFILNRGSKRYFHHRPELAVSYQFHVCHQSEVSGILYADIFKTNIPQQPVGLWRCMVKHRATFEDKQHQLYSLLMFIGSCDFCLNGIGYVYLHPAKTSTDIFNFIVSCGFTPKVHELGWTSSTSMDLTPTSLMPLDWYINNKPPRATNLWSCPIVILSSNLQKIFDESFDLESSL